MLKTPYSYKHLRSIISEHKLHYPYWKPPKVFIKSLSITYLPYIAGRGELDKELKLIVRGTFLLD